MLVAEREDSRYRGSVRGRQHRKRLAAEQRAVILQHRRDSRGISDQRIFAGGGR
jgi:hypothetical protein